MNYSNTGTVEIDVVKEFVDPERVVILNLDEQNEVEATRDITTRLRMRMYRSTSSISSTYRTCCVSSFPRQNKIDEKKDSSVVKFKLLSKKPRTVSYDGSQIDFVI